MSKSPESTEIDSIFSDEEGEGFHFSLTQMEILVSQKLGTPCHLRKLAEGGYHKVSSGSFTLSFSNRLAQVYDVVVAGENEVKAVARVALPDFPVDKMESEVGRQHWIHSPLTVSRSQPSNIFLRIHQ